MYVFVKGVASDERNTVKVKMNLTKVQGARNERVRLPEIVIAKKKPSKPR